jgi:hypothetical protein
VLLRVGRLRVGVGFVSVSETSDGCSVSFFAADSCFFSGWDPRVRRADERRVLGFADVFLGLAAFVSPASAGFVSAGSGVGAAATSGAAGSSMRAPTDETRLPFFPVRFTVPRVAGVAG